MEKEFDLMAYFADIFQQLCLDGLKPTIIPKLEFLFNELNKDENSENYNNPIIINTIYILERYNLDNLLVNLEIDIFKQKCIKSVIESFDNNTEEDLEEFNNNFDCNKKKLANEIEDRLFIDTRYGKMLRDKSNLPPKGQYVKFREMDTNGKGVEYTVNDEGFLVYSDEIGDEFSLENIDYDEIYSEDLLDALEYVDNEGDKKVEENNL